MHPKSFAHIHLQTWPGSGEIPFQSSQVLLNPEKPPWEMFWLLRAAPELQGGRAQSTEHCRALQTGIAPFQGHLSSDITEIPFAAGTVHKWSIKLTAEDILDVWNSTGLNSIHFDSPLIWIRSHESGGASAAGMMLDYFSCYLKNKHPKLNLDLSAPHFWFYLVPHKTLKPTCHLCQNLPLIPEGDAAPARAPRIIFLLMSSYLFCAGIFVIL